jgi:prepilin peptidase CpaA
MIADILRLTLFPALMAFAASSDLFTMTISNRVSLLLVAGFVLLAGLTGMGSSEFLNHIGAGLAVLTVAFTCFAFGWIGGGDAKIAAAASLWFGFADLFEFLAYASVFGGILTFALLSFRRLPMPYQLGGQAWLMRLHHQDSGVPYGIALAMGGLVVYPHTQWMAAVDVSRFAFALAN